MRQYLHKIVQNELFIDVPFLVGNLSLKPVCEYVGSDLVKQFRPSVSAQNLACSRKFAPKVQQ